MSETPSVSRRQLVILSIAFEGGLVVLAWVLGVVFRTPAFGQLDLNLPGLGWGTLGTVPLLAGLYWTSRSRWPPLVRLREVLQLFVGRLFAEAQLVDLLLISVLAGVGEEALFRGVIQTLLENRLGLWLAIALTSLLFGLAHFITVTYAIVAALISVYLGWLLVAFDNLLVPVVVHALYDFLALVYLVRIRPARDPSQEEGISRGPTLSGEGDLRE